MRSVIMQRGSRRSVSLRRRCRRLDSTRSRRCQWRCRLRWLRVECRVCWAGTSCLKDKSTISSTHTTLNTL